MPTAADKIWRNNMEYYEGDDSAGGPVANWDPSLCRFIFLDGDNGDDSNPGFIDAPAGTTFTPAQTGPIALRTTRRINELRPPVGAGRTVAVLLSLARVGRSTMRGSFQMTGWESRIDPCVPAIRSC